MAGVYSPHVTPSVGGQSVFVCPCWRSPLWLTSRRDISCVINPIMQCTSSSVGDRNAQGTVKPIFHCNEKLLPLGVCVGQFPNAKFCDGYTNMLESKNAKICVTSNAKNKICVTPNAKPQSKQIDRKIFELAMYIPCTSFHLPWLPNANPVCSGIWALGLYSTRRVLVALGKITQYILHWLHLKKRKILFV